MNILIHHSELILKGKNRSYFENKLVRNIKKKFSGAKVIKDLGRILLKTEKDIDLSKLKKIFGIKFYSPVQLVTKKELFNTIEQILKETKEQTIKPITKRSDKTFEITSLEVNKKIGEITSNLGKKIDFKNGKEIFTEITKENVYIYTEKIYCYGGLPVASSGKVLCLLSGGIDSPVASWLMMKRGCKIDFLHFHTFKENKQVLGTKIEKLAKQLTEYQFSSKLYLIPYHDYQFATIKAKQKLDLVMFKNFMLKTASEIAKKEGYQAILTGDAVGQVASQTLQNLAATSYDVKSLILRPLTGFNKEEIITLAQQIGVYETSIEEYKDCCSIIAKKPATKAKIEKIEEEKQKINFPEIIKKSLEEMEMVRVWG